MNLVATLHHYLLPRHTNNYKARLLHSSMMILAAVFLLSSHLLIQRLNVPIPSVLGYAANISTQDVINLTNQKREAAGLSDLNYSEDLAKAAKMKGEHMLANNYWAHIAPDGTDPWYFFKQVGYTYRYAGENLARDFSDSTSTVEAWMASPSHRENMLSPKYSDIGVAVVEGDLSGKDTTIVVQLFGTRSGEAPTVPVAAAKVNQPPSGTVSTVNAAQVPESTISQSPVKAASALGQFGLMRNLTLLVVFVFVALLVADIFIVSRRGIVRSGGRTFAHLSFMAMVFIIILLAKAGQIL